MKNELQALNIIDNSPNKKLVEVLKDKLSKSKEVKFAIGYFFLSGFSLVENDFPQKCDKKPFLKIVMGNETTYPTKEELVAGYKLREIFKQRMIEDLQGITINDEVISRLKFLKDFIADNIIDVKLYDKSKMHAKLYLFLTNPDEKYGSPGLAIVGSSNFTAEGLAENKELNVLLTSREEVLYLNKWFDELWNEAEEFREDLLKVIEYSGILSPESPYPKIGKLIDPKTLFKYLVYNWFEGRVLNLLKKDILMEFQLVGVVNAVNIINFYNGVILADSVGLGKSFMASAVIEEFLTGKHPTWIANNEKIPGVLLILPPSIIPQWEELLIGRIDEKVKNELLKGEKIKLVSDYFFQTNFKKLVIENDIKTYEVYDETEEKLLGKISFLSLGIFQNYEIDDKNIYIDPRIEKLREEYDLFVIDEAHKYRNKNTNRGRAVRYLQKKSDNFPNKFILLTATPLHNSIIDIFNLLGLFNDEDTFEPFQLKKGVNVKDRFNEYINLKRVLKEKDDDEIRKRLKEVATKIKEEILNEIMVLRTRKYIMEQFKDIKVNGKPLVFKEPQTYGVDYSIFYTNEYRNLIKLISQRLNEILFEYTKLYGTRFVVFEEEGIEKGEEKLRYIEIADLFKLLLGKRLESSIYPFETTLRRIYEKEKKFYEILTAKFNDIVSEEILRDVIEEAVKAANIKKDLEIISDEFSLEEESQETWFDRVKNILFKYAADLKEPGIQYLEIDLLKLGLKKVIDNLEKDLKTINEILQTLDNLKEKENGEIKNLGKIPKKEEDITDLSIFCYRNDPKLETLKQLLGTPDRKSEKLKEIPSLNRKKIIIFTQYMDTAYYLYHNISEWIKNEIDLHRWLMDTNFKKIKIGLVTGETDTPTKINFIKRFAPNANNGYEEVSRFGELEILVSTDALSEGVNLQDADAVINYDLPWNPMIIVQRVGRVNRIGNEKDVVVINFIPSNEIETLVGILKTLQEKIKDITLVIGKETAILTPEEEISVETFGEKIKNISKLSITDLEEYGISEDFKQFIPEGIPQEQLDEYKLLNIIQYELEYTPEDFQEVINMEDEPYYSYLQFEPEKIISIYEFYRGKYKIMKKIMSINPQNGELNYETPIVFLDLIKKSPKAPIKIDKAIENLKKLKEKTEEIVEELKEKYKQEQKGFLYHLYNALLPIRENLDENIRNKFNRVMIVLQLIHYYRYTSDIKSLLTQKGLIEINKDSISIKDYRETIETLFNFFKEKGKVDIESLEVRVKHLGWYYEV